MIYLVSPAVPVGRPDEGQAEKDDASIAKAQAAEAPVPPAQQSSYEKPTYSGAPTGKGKLETTLGGVKFRFYGTLLMNISFADSLELGQDVPLWPVPGNATIAFPDGTTKPAGDIHDLIFTARQTVMGFTLGEAKPSGTRWSPSALVEFDFFGSRPSDPLQPQGRVLNQPRLRLAYFQLEKENWKIVAGQDKVIIAPLDPVSLSHVGVPLGATAGNLWGWLPQVRVDYKHDLGNTSALFQLGVLRPQFNDPRLGDIPTPGTALDAVFSGFGERAAQPFYQGRLAVSRPWRGSTSTVGAGLHYGRERVGADRTIDSWAFALDYDVPFRSRLTLRGEAFLGSNLVPFQGGILQGIAATPGLTTIHRIGDGGGWVELTVLGSEDGKNVFYVGAGTDDPRDEQLLPPTNRSKNSFGWASYFRKLTEDVTLAFEWSNWRFRTKNFVGGVPGPEGPSGRGNVFNLALAYQF
jgi:hypothetical protein